MDSIVGFWYLKSLIPMKFFYLIIGVFCLVARPAFSANLSDGIPLYRLGLNQCIGLALKQNEQIKAAFYDIQTVVAQKIEATKRAIPVVKFKYRVAPVPQDVNNPASSFFKGDISILNSFKVEVGAPVYTFGRLNIAKTLADLGIDLKALQKQKKEEEVALNIYKLYQGILLARELRILIHEGFDAIDKKIAELETEETSDQLQILKLKVILYEVERKLQDANSKEVIAIATLKALMGLEDDVDFDINDKSLKQEKFTHKNFDEILELSKQHRPEYQLLHLGLLAKSKKIDLEKREYFPTIGVGGFFDFGVTPGIVGDESETEFTNPFNYTRAGVGLELESNLDFRKIKSKVELAKADYYKTLAEKRAASRGLELDLKKSFLELKENRFLLSRAEKDKRAARQMVFLTKSNLDIGLGEKKDYLDALQTYLLFQGRAFEAIFNYNNAVATLKLKMGLLYQEQKEL